MQSSREQAGMGPIAAQGGRGSGSKVQCSREQAGRGGAVKARGSSRSSGTGLKRLRKGPAASKQRQ